MEFLFKHSSWYLNNKILSWTWEEKFHISRQPCIILLMNYINILHTPKSQLNSCFKERARCHSFMVLNKAIEWYVPAADWLSQTHMKNYRNFSHVVIWFFSVVEIPIKHSSLCNVIHYNVHTNFKVAGKIWWLVWLIFVLLVSISIKQATVLLPSPLLACRVTISRIMLLCCTSQLKYIFWLVSLVKMSWCPWVNKTS